MPVFLVLSKSVRIDLQGWHIWSPFVLVVCETGVLAHYLFIFMRLFIASVSFDICYSLHVYNFSVYVVSYMCLSYVLYVHKLIVAKRQILLLTLRI